MKMLGSHLAALLPLLGVFAAAGCDSPDNRRPASAMPIQSAPITPKKPPSTTEEKIAAIQNAPIPDKDKQAAIERVRSGKL